VGAPNDAYLLAADGSAIRALTQGVDVLAFGWLR